MYHYLLGNCVLSLLLYDVVDFALIFNVEKSCDQTGHAVFNCFQDYIFSSDSLHTLVGRCLNY